MSSPQRTPRVFLDGDVVPAGVCVLDTWGAVFYLDETGICRCDDDVDVCECSFPVVNGDGGPLVEVFKPENCGVLIAAELARREATPQPHPGGAA